MKAFVDIRNLKTHFPILQGLFNKQTGAVKAVDGVNITIGQGQWVGLVGESGCGKTTLGKTLLRLLKPTAGHIYFDVPENIKDEIGKLEESESNPKRLHELRQKYDMATYSGKQLKSVRKNMQLVHQDPFTSLNPRMKIGNIIAEPMAVHGIARGEESRKKVAELLSRVGLPEKSLRRYPHQFSGGQRQRIAIARALAPNPKLLVLDEPTSALDVSVQAQILNLLKELKQEQTLTYLYITHDLRVAESVCDNMIVMYLGKIVEMGKPTELFRTPKHPYSQALTLSTPIADPTLKRKRFILPGEVPSPANPPSGCRFHPRCTRATEECRRLEPPLKPAGGVSLVACWHPLN